MKQLQQQRPSGSKRTSKRRDPLEVAIEKASTKGERIPIRRNGRRAAVVPIEDLELLEAFEDFVDILEVSRRDAEAKRKGDKPIPWADAKKILGW
jgi:hypothetical protein